MSVPTRLQSRLVPMSLSTDGITYRNVVCKRTANFTGTTPVNQESDDCGSSSALDTNQWSFDFEGTFNTTPNADEYSAKDILGFWNNQTLMYVRLQYPTNGTSLFIAGQGYLTGTGISTTTGSLVTFSFTFTGDGDVDLTP